jgi:hypothetical protein
LTRLQNVGLPAGWDDLHESKRHPKVPFRVEFWADRQLLIDSKVSVGAKIKLRTKGATHFADSIWLTDATPLTAGTSYAGENTADSWTEKVMGQKGKVKEDPPKKADPDKDGVADDEW